MQAIWVITKREIKTFFDSLMAYILIVLFLAVSGLFTWLFFSDVFLNKQASLDPFFYSAYFTLFIIIPAITMKMLAEENRLHSIAFPAISCGIYGYPLDAAAATAIESTLNTLKQCRHCDHVIFACFSADIEAAFSQALAHHSL